MARSNSSQFFYLMILQYTQQFSLEGQRQLSYFIKENSPPVCHLKLSLLA